TPRRDQRVRSSAPNGIGRRTGFGANPHHSSSSCEVTRSRKAAAEIKIRPAAALVSARRVGRERRKNRVDRGERIARVPHRGDLHLRRQLLTEGLLRLQGLRVAHAPLLHQLGGGQLLRERILIGGVALLSKGEILAARLPEKLAQGV